MRPQGFGELILVDFNVIFGAAGMVCALVITGIGLPRQIILNYRRKSTEGISLLVIVFAFGSYTSFTLYGLTKPEIDWFLVVGYALGSCFGIVLLIQTYLYQIAGRGRR